MSTQATYYLHWGVVQISLANLLVIVAMIVVFLAALALQMPAHHDAADHDEEAGDDGD